MAKSKSTIDNPSVTREEILRLTDLTSCGG